jgi:hypothetical protein
MAKYLLNPERILQDTLNVSIPKTKEQAINTGKLIVTTWGLRGLKTLVYSPGINAAEKRVKKAKEEKTKTETNLYNSKIPNPPVQDSPKTHPFLPQYESFLNTAVFSDLDVSFTADIGTVINIKIPTVLFTVTQSKNIITTAIQGRNGTVKEYISDGDFKINIKGVITNSNGKYPQFKIDKGQSTVNDLFQMCQLNKSLTVNSWYLWQFCVYEMVITDYEFPQLEGQYSSQPFEINAISDTPFVINNTNSENKKAINRSYIPFI